jgi:cephalosporin hydroxylase
MFDQLAHHVSHEVKMLRGAFYRRLSGVDLTGSATDAFHRLYFDARAFNLTWRNTYWLGHQVLKCPLDLWLYQELVCRVRPAVIVETGTAFGGSALFLASVCDMVGRGRVITIDVEAQGVPSHPRIEYLTGSSTDDRIVESVRGRIDGTGPVMVFLDSDHRKEHVLAELHTYAPLVTPSSYLVVEDTNLNGHPVEPDFGPGPMEAVEEFLAAHPAFRPDPEMAKFILSFNPGGYLRRAS